MPPRDRRAGKEAAVTLLVGEPRPGAAAGAPADADARGDGPAAGDPSLPWWAAATGPVDGQSARPVTGPAPAPRGAARRTAVVAAVALAAVAAFLAAVVATEPEEVVVVPGHGLAHRQTTSALVGGCGRMYTFDDATEQSATVASRLPGGAVNRQSYRTTVPVFGRFWAEPAPAGRVFWSRGERVPRPENLLANMWDGQLVVYYSADVPRETVRELARLARSRPELELLVVPWPRGRPDLPRGRDLAFATWNWSQTCHDFVPEALEDFRRLHPASQAPGHDGTRPPSLAG